MSLPNSYKLQCHDPCNKVKAKVHQDSSKPGVKFTNNKTIPNFEKGAKKVNLNWTHLFIKFDNMYQGQYKTAWKQVVQENFPEPVDPEMVSAKGDH